MHPQCCIHISCMTRSALSKQEMMTSFGNNCSLWDSGWEILAQHRANTRYCQRLYYTVIMWQQSATYSQEQRSIRGKIYETGSMPSYGRASEWLRCHQRHCCSAQHMSLAIANSLCRKEFWRIRPSCQVSIHLLAEHPHAPCLVPLVRIPALLSSVSIHYPFWYIYGRPFDRVTGLRFGYAGKYQTWTWQSTMGRGVSAWEFLLKRFD